MELNVLERILATSLLPAQGDFATLRTVTEARTNLALTEEEIKDFDFKTENGMMTWNDKGKESKEIELSKSAQRLIADLLVALDASKELKENQITLYEKFVV